MKMNVAECLRLWVMKSPYPARAEHARAMSEAGRETIILLRPYIPLIMIPIVAAIIDAVIVGLV